MQRLVNPDRRQDIETAVVIDSRDRGFGDTLARWLAPIANRLGAKDCQACGVGGWRREFVNKLWPYKHPTLTERNTDGPA